MRDVLLGILIGAAGAAALTRRRKLKHRGGGDWYPGKNPPVDGSCILPYSEVYIDEDGDGMMVGNGGGDRDGGADAMDESGPRQSFGKGWEQFKFQFYQHSLIIHSSTGHFSLEGLYFKKN